METCATKGLREAEMNREDAQMKEITQQEKSRTAAKILNILKNQEVDYALDILRLALTQLLPGFNVAIRVSSVSE